MKQDKIDKLLIFAFNSGALDTEAISAFLKARNLILKGAGGYNTTAAPAAATTAPAPATEYRFDSSGETDITCGSIKMMHLVEETTKLAFTHHSEIKLRIRTYGKVLNPSAIFIFEGSSRLCETMQKIIDTVYNTTF